MARAGTPFGVLTSGDSGIFLSDVRIVRHSLKGGHTEEGTLNDLYASANRICRIPVPDASYDDHAFFGHPRGLSRLRYAEFWGQVGVVGAQFAPERRGMIFAIKAEVGDLRATTFAFAAQKTMYGGKRIAKGDVVFVFASENEGGQGLIAQGIVTSARAIPKKRGIERQTPRVSLTIRRTALAKRAMGRSQLKHFTDWNDGQPETELNFKFYRQATNKIVGISDSTAAFLSEFF
jgi:hypothetical protein